MISGQELERNAVNADLAKNVSGYADALCLSATFDFFIHKLPDCDVEERSHLEENGNNSVNGPSSIENFSRSSIDTSFKVCTAVASKTILFSSVISTLRISVPRNDCIPQLIPSFECLKPTLNSDTPPTSIRQSPESMLETWGN